jgi:hypothetical protein
MSGEVSEAVDSKTDQESGRRAEAEIAKRVAASLAQCLSDDT